MKILIHLLALQLLFLFNPLNSKAQLVLIVKNIQEVKGNIIYGVYDVPEYFLSYDKQLLVDTVAVTNDNQKIIFDSLPPGVYGISIFQDLNEDGEMEKNFIGYPLEPYGFSNNLRPVLKAPRFKEAALDYDGEYLEVEIYLID
jgi:uncharacterized protein (DUF2141 family)